MALPDSIAARTGRLVLLVATFVALLLALGALLFVGRGGAIHSEALGEAVGVVLEHYALLLTIMGAFLFAARGKGDAPEEASTPLTTFVFALALCGLWLLAPIALLLLTPLPVEEILGHLQGDTAQVVAQPLVAAAVTFYFTRSA